MRVAVNVKLCVARLWYNESTRVECDVFSVAGAADFLWRKEVFVTTWGPPRDVCVLSHAGKWISLGRSW